MAKQRRPIGKLPVFPGCPVIFPSFGIPATVLPPSGALPARECPLPAPPEQPDLLPPGPPVPAPAPAEEEELTDDLELVAVITAAIAASENTSADGLVVRSIKRAPVSKWKRA